MAPAGSRLLLLLFWTVTLLSVAVGAVTAYVGPLYWLSSLLLWASGFYTLLSQAPRLAPATSTVASWLLCVVGAGAVITAACYFAASPVLFPGWFVGLVSFLVLLATPQARPSRLALLLTAAGLVGGPWVVLRHTSLLPSIAAGSEAHLQLLLRCGANANELRHHETPLLAAVRLGRDDMVETLLRQGADPNGRSSAFMNSTPVLFDAARLPAGKQRVLWLLLQHGADPNLRNGSGETALFHALRFKQLQNAQALLEAGARTTIRNKQGRTPAEEAQQ